MKEEILEFFDGSDSAVSDINYDIIAKKLLFDEFGFPPEVEFD